MRRLCTDSSRSYLGRSAPQAVRADGDRPGSDHTGIRRSRRCGELPAASEEAAATTIDVTARRAATRAVTVQNMETPQLRPVSSPTRYLKSASALSVQRILLPRMVNPRKLSRSCEAQAMSRGRSARVSQRAPPAQGPAARQRHPLCGQELLAGERGAAVEGHADCGGHH